MSNFVYQDSVLHAEAMPLPQLAKQFGTPSYIYSYHAIKTRWAEFERAFSAAPHLICYAVKANSNIAILNLLARLGAGFDIVSTGELQRVIAAGGDPTKVVFSGVGKRADEMKFALSQHIKCFNIESVAELTTLNAVAAALNLTAPVSLRVNPDVDAMTHPYIATGVKANKFGIAFTAAREVYQLAMTLTNIKVVGIDCHIGSQITRLEPFKAALDKVLALVVELEQQGIKLLHLNIGGGLGITYQHEVPPAPAAYVKLMTDSIQGYGLELIIEPGRSIVGNAGILLTKVLYLKATPVRHFAIIDAAMNDLIRPALYEGWHDVKPVLTTAAGKEQHYDIVGPVCETADCLAKARLLTLQQGDLLAILSAGAYGASMASTYNSRPRVAEVMVAGDRAYEIRRRETVAELIGGESLLPKSVVI